jgi:hypothetical protein
MKTHESKRLRQHKWRIRNQCCVVCGRSRPSRIILICNKCKERNWNGATEVRA